MQQNDTLEGIAARYNITPSELTVLNKLSSRIVFPGQVIFKNIFDLKCSYNPLFWNIQLYHNQC